MRPSRCAAGDFEVAARSEDIWAIETIRVATTDTLVEHYLIPALATLRTTAVVTGWACVNLLRGEADVAFRLVRPNHARLVAREVADFALRAYASPRYIAARGAPVADFATTSSSRTPTPTCRRSRSPASRVSRSAR